MFSVSSVSQRGFIKELYLIRAHLFFYEKSAILNVEYGPQNSVPLCVATLTWYIIICQPKRFHPRVSTQYKPFFALWEILHLGWLSMGLKIVYQLCTCHPDLIPLNHLSGKEVLSVNSTQYKNILFRCETLSFWQAKRFHPRVSTQYKPIVSLWEICHLESWILPICTSK